MERVRFRRANEGRGTTYLTVAYAHRSDPSQQDSAADADSDLLVGCCSGADHGQEEEEEEGGMLKVRSCAWCVVGLCVWGGMMVESVSTEPLSIHPSTCMQEMGLEYSLPFVAAAQLGSRAERGALLRNVLTTEDDDDDDEQKHGGDGRQWALAWPLLQPVGLVEAGSSGVTVLRALPFTETAAALRFRAYQVRLWGGLVTGCLCVVS